MLHVEVEKEPIELLHVFHGAWVEREFFLEYEELVV